MAFDEVKQDARVQRAAPLLHVLQMILAEVHENNTTDEDMRNGFPEWNACVETLSTSAYWKLALAWRVLSTILALGQIGDPRFIAVAEKNEIQIREFDLGHGPRHIDETVIVDRKLNAFAIDARADASDNVVVTKSGFVKSPVGWHIVGNNTGGHG